MNPDLAARKAALQRRKLKASQPTSFYGSAAANILGRKDGASSGSGQFRYTSTWVDEMREELEDFDGVDDLSDDDDLDDFVVDSGDDLIDDGDQEDYSSHIRKIFGYDKRRQVCVFLHFYLPSRVIVSCTVDYVCILCTS